MRQGESFLMQLFSKWRRAIYVIKHTRYDRSIRKKHGHDVLYNACFICGRSEALGVFVWHFLRPLPWPFNKRDIMKVLNQLSMEVSASPNETYAGSQESAFTQIVNTHLNDIY